MRIRSAYLVLFIAFALATRPVHGQGITFGSGTTVSLGNATLYLSGNWSDNGTFNAGSGTVVFDGTGTQTISDPSGETFYNLTVNKASGNLQFLNDVTVNGTASVTNGTLDLNGHSLSFGSSGTLSETSGKLASGGSVTASSTLSAPSSVNIGGLGAEITSSANLGNTTITRGSTAQMGNGNFGIKRYYDIAPTNDNALNATLVFHYDTSELNGLNESTLQVFRSTDGGTTWVNMGGTVNTTAKTVTLTGVGSFSRWTLGSSDQSLPVQATGFAARADIGSVTISWKTQSEVDNAGFNVLRSDGLRAAADSTSVHFRLVASFAVDDSLKGLGTSSTGRSYDFTDKKVQSGQTYEYKIQSVSTTGETKDLTTLSVTVDVPKTYALYQNYPNPFNPNTMINYQLPINSSVTLKIYDILGREVATLIDQQQDAGVYHVTFDGTKHSSGVYFYRLTAQGNGQRFVSIKKLVLTK